MTMMVLPFASELVAALVAALAVLFAVKRRPVKDAPHDWQKEYHRIEMKVRKPWTYRMRQWMGE